MNIICVRGTWCYFPKPLLRTFLGMKHHGMKSFFIWTSLWFPPHKVHCILTCDVSWELKISSENCLTLGNSVFQGAVCPQELDWKSMFPRNAVNLPCLHFLFQSGLHKRFAVLITMTTVCCLFPAKIIVTQECFPSSVISFGWWGGIRKCSGSAYVDVRLPHMPCLLETVHFTGITNANLQVIFTRTILFRCTYQSKILSICRHVPSPEESCL